ncbi:hypothetical protein TPA0910_05140 [Streptomyces hygroscopicus subsp. sporocinereus]|uniref:Uncharacterized protein n=1 Tax=Streptomyces hygroscopicus TaxID=1912 RepID=A0ABQ3TRY3_STRHY|nr:hypothetical protein TPA0910_05140 [Streptomyces hygroscopicus]
MRTALGWVHPAGPPSARSTAPAVARASAADAPVVARASAADGTGSGAGERRRTGRVAHHQGPVEQPAGA